MRTSAIILSRLDAALQAQGIKLKRSQILEVAGAAFAYHNSHEFAAAARAGDLDPPKPEVLGRVPVGDEALIVVRDPRANAIYGIDETFISQVVDAQSHERFGPSPYGHLLNIGELIHFSRLATDTSETPRVGGGRYHACDPDLGLLAATDDLDAARTACRDGSRDNLESYIVDRQEWALMRAKWLWRTEPLDRQEDAATAAAQLRLKDAELEDVQNRLESTLNIDVPDWRSWERDLKKASHKKLDPISDEILHQFRHAVADVHCKSSSGERATVELRQQRYVDKHLGGLLARLDQAEDALREAGLAPAKIMRKSEQAASERLAAIEAVSPTHERGAVPGLYEVDATRDGDRCHEIFQVHGDEDPEDRGRAIAAKAFRMDIALLRNEDGDLSDFDSECDTFTVQPVQYPGAAAIISDALAELSRGSDFRYGMPMDHPARIKLLAAREQIVPKPTVA